MEVVNKSWDVNTWS